MPVQIGAKAHHYTDPTGLLSDCHRRIEMFLGTLGAVAEAIDRPATEDVRRGLESALRYFKEAAPKHTADEEESLFPRLRRRIADSDVASALARLEELEAEHRRAYPLHAELEQIGEKYLANEGLSAQEVERFRRSIQHLRAMYEPHIKLEDSVVFPLAARVLSQQEKSAIAEEMADRRKVKLAGIDKAK